MASGGDDDDHQLEQRLAAARQQPHGTTEPEELAALLCDVANLKLRSGNGDAAQALLDEAYALRRGAIAAEAAEAPAGCSKGRQRDGDGGGSGDGSGDGSGGAAWDASDDEWEPDVSALKPAKDFLASGGGGGGKSNGAAEDDDGGGGGSGRGQNTWRSGGGGGPDSSDSWRSRARVAGGPTPGLLQRRAAAGAGAAAPSSADGDWTAAKLAAPRAPSLPHVVEVHGLTRGVTTADLELFLLDYVWGGLAPTLRWVDDAHALAVFPCEAAAGALLEAGARGGLRYAVRPYAAASAGAHELTAEELVPPRALRPKTTTAVARRLIGQALGVSAAVRDRAAEAELAGLRQAGRERRRAAAVARAEAWGDDDDGGGGGGGGA